MFSARRQLYPTIEPYRIDFLRVSQTHEIYYEESGKSSGQPVLFLHGGPGSGSHADFRRIFDPKHYRIVLFDQRGAGKSRPLGMLQENNLSALIEDIETLRIRLGVNQWIVYGGSWGSLLALAYTEAHSKSVKALILRGVFLGTKRQLDWAYNKLGRGRLLPEAYDRFIAAIPEAERADPLAAYYRRFLDSDPEIQATATREWTRYEAAAERLIPIWNESASITEPMIARAKIISHYKMNNCFLNPDNQILRDIDRVRSLPGVIIHGRYDLMCPIENAWELRGAWPEAEYKPVPDAGHSWNEPGIVHETILATDKFRKL